MLAATGSSHRTARYANQCRVMSGSRAAGCPVVFVICRWRDATSTVEARGVSREPPGPRTADVYRWIAVITRVIAAKLAKALWSRAVAITPVIVANLGEAL